ncbi:hypothetical protein BDR07DRAFT_1416185 [Suillus spraguei]|nr:hypothetical protein BDR07DRAFT_1416185 [Suillus spraguei]
MPNNVPNLYRWGVFTRLANRLDSLDRMLEALDELMKFRDAEDRQIRRYGRKIITLTEIANATLSWQVGVSLIMFCRENHVQHKSAYYKLLLLIKCRRSAFPADLDDRIDELLARVECRVVLRTRGIDPRTQLGIKELIIK